MLLSPGRLWRVVTAISRCGSLEGYSTIASSPTRPMSPDGIGNCVPCPLNETAPALTPLVVIVNEVRSFQLWSRFAPPLLRNRKAPEGSQDAATGRSLIGTAVPICDSVPLDGSTAR